MEETKKINWVNELVPYAVIVVVVLLIRIFILVNAFIPSPSMENTMMTGSRVLGLKTAYWFSEPQRGDIIVFHAPDEPETLYVKRLIGLPGETVEIEDGVVYIDGEALEEGYLAEEMEWEPYMIFEVPEGCYFMMGDNRNVSDDARYWYNTYLSKDAIVGKVYLEYWPHPHWLAKEPEY